MTQTIGPIWKSGIGLMRFVMAGNESNLEKLFKIQRTELFAINSTSKEERLLSADEYWKLIGKVVESNYSFGESPFYSGELTFLHHDRAVSLDFYKKCYLANLCGQCDTILEIGAGFGQVARIALLAGQCRKYIIVDLAETLFFSKVFLENSLPDFTIVLAKSVADFDKQCDVLLIPNTLYTKFIIPNSVDVFLNSSSLGEMDNSTSTAYIKWIEQSPIKKIVLLNRLLNTYNPRVEAFRQNECGWYFALNNLWRVERWELEPTFTRIGYEQCMHHRELLFVASKTEIPQIPSVAWSTGQRWLTNYSELASTKRNNILFPNEMILFELLEAVRLDPIPKHVDALLRYLKCLGMKYPFEEEAYLFKLWKSKVERDHPFCRLKFYHHWTTQLGLIVNRMKGIRR